MTTVELLSNFLIDSFHDRYTNRTNFNNFSISRLNDNNNETFTRGLSHNIINNLNNLAIRDYINIDEIQIQHIDNSINTIINNIINNNYYVDDNVLLIIYEIIEHCDLNLNNNTSRNGFTLRDLRIIINDLNRNRINNCKRELLIIYILLKHSYYLQHSTHLINNTTTNIQNNSIRNNLIQNTRNTIRINNIAGYNNTNYNNTNITTTFIRQNEPEYPGINDINGIVGPRGPTGSTGEQGYCIYEQPSTLQCKITCPFCRNKNDRAGWIKTNITDTCEICFHDNKIMYKSNKCEHKTCKHCVDNIKK
jgi:hypothetical protein